MSVLSGSILHAAGEGHKSRADRVRESCRVWPNLVGGLASEPLTSRPTAANLEGDDNSETCGEFASWGACSCYVVCVFSSLRCGRLATVARTQSQWRVGRPQPPDRVESDSEYSM